MIYNWTCPECKSRFTSGTKFEPFQGCPICQRKELVEHHASGGKTRFPVNLSEEEIEYIDGWPQHH